MKQSLLLAAAALLLAGTALTACKNKNAAPDETAEPAAVLTPVAFSADSALAYVEAQCAFGPRVPNSAAHRACGDWIVEKFRSFGLEVTQQEAVFTGWDGKRLDGRNLIASYRPEAEERVVLAAHWDCRPWADADPDSSRHREPVMGANDGASGVAVLLELARQADSLAPQVGIDFGKMLSAFHEQQRLTPRPKPLATFDFFSIFSSKKRKRTQERIKAIENY